MVCVTPGYDPESINIDSSRKGLLLAWIDPESALHTGSVDSFPRRFAL